MVGGLGETATSYAAVFAAFKTTAPQKQKTSA